MTIATVTLEAEPADLTGAHGDQLAWRLWRLAGDGRELIPFGAWAGDAALEVTIILEPGTYELTAGRRGVGRRGQFILDGAEVLVTEGGAWLAAWVESEPTVLVRSPDLAPERQARPVPQPSAPQVKPDPNRIILAAGETTLGEGGKTIAVALTRDSLDPVMRELRSQGRHYRTLPRQVTVKGIAIPVWVMIEIE